MSGIDMMGDGSVVGVVAVVEVLDMLYQFDRFYTKNERERERCMTRIRIRMVRSNALSLASRRDA